MTNLLDALLEKPDEFADFDFLSFWQVQFNSAVAIAVFFAWVKVRHSAYRDVYYEIQGLRHN